MERPILFSGPMVLAILEGRKTVTRRIVKPQSLFEGKESILRRFPNQAGCPYGKPGDRLWVRETHYPIGETGQVFYCADDSNNFGDDLHWTGPWKPSIFMRRQYSRITLNITVVRAELLQDITEEDARAEGVTVTEGHNKVSQLFDECRPDLLRIAPAQQAFSELWDSINGKTFPWSSNPFVWRIEFIKI